MKQYLTVFIVVFLTISCGATKKNDKEGITAKDAPTAKIIQTPKKTQDSVMMTISTGTKISATTPIKDMETASTPSKTEPAVEINPQVFVPPVQTELFDHTSWNSLVHRYVSEKGVVHYEGFKKDRNELNNYIASLGRSMPTENWSKNDKLAYWMNAYNAMTVDLILRNLPLKSIKDIESPWEQRLWKLGDTWYNLDEIEHQILRKMDEPRIHFGINCASYSCPPLLPEAFTAEKVDSQLTYLAKRFINDPSRNSIQQNEVEISKIFDWFSKDFKNQGSVIDYLNQYATTQISSKARVRYKDYNWELNN